MKDLKLTDLSAGNELSSKMDIAQDEHKVERAPTRMLGWC